MGYSGRVRPRLLVIRVKYDNNYGHKIPKYVKDPYDRDNLDTWRGKYSTLILDHPHTLTGNITIGTIKVGGIRGTYHV